MYQINRMKCVVIHGKIIQSLFSFMMEETAAAALIIDCSGFEKKRERTAKRKKIGNTLVLQRPIFGSTTGRGG